MKRWIWLLTFCAGIVAILLVPIAAGAAVGPPPVITTNPATGITCYSATLNGFLVFQQIVPLAPIVFFQYGTASGYYLGTTEQIVLPASGSFQTTLTGLSPNMTYFARAGMLLPLITAIAPPDVHEYFIAGAGVGFNNTALLRKVAVVVGNPEPIYGNEISFTTACGTTGGGNTNVSVSNPVSLPTITVLNATLAAGKAAPGEKVGITATLANKGNSNGTSKVTL